MAARDDEYRRFVTAQPCICQPCATPPEFHHMTHAPVYAPGERKPKQRGGARGKGQTAADYYGLALCPRHRGQRHSLKGYFDGWTGEELRNWERAEHARLRRLYEGQAPARSADPAVRPIATNLDVDVANFIQDNDLDPSVAHDLRALIRRAKQQGREEERASGRRPR